MIFLFKLLIMYIMSLTERTSKYNNKFSTIQISKVLRKYECPTII